MEYKGGRIKEHRKKEKMQNQDEWLDIEWLDEDDETVIQADEPGSIHTEEIDTSSQEEQLEIEDWRDAENWNLTQSDSEEKEEPAREVSDEKPVSGQRQNVKRRPSSGRPKRQGASDRPSGARKARPAADAAGQRSAKKRPDQQEQRRKREDRKQKVQSAAQPVKAAGRVAGKAGKTAGKAVGRGICIVMKCGCFVAMAVIVLEFWQEFWAERSTLGEIWRVAADRNYAQALYLGIAGVILLYGVLSAIWLLGGKKMPDGNHLRTYDTGRGLTAFVLFALLAGVSGFVLPLIPESPQILDGAKLVLTVADRIRTVVLGCCAAGAVLCIVRKVISR